MHEPLPRRSAAANFAQQHVLHRDYETRSRAILKKVGAHRYAADPRRKFSVRPMPSMTGRCSCGCPAIRCRRNSSKLRAIRAGLSCAHNDAFETAIEQHVLAPRYGWPLIPLERHRCTMAMCAGAGLPARLSAAADALELANRKDAAGERLMHQMSKPRKPRKGEDPAGTYWFDDPERLQRLYGYCRQDVEVERELYHRLPPLSAAEQALWVLSCRINERGFHVDRQFAEAARRIAQAAAPEIDAELAEITGGAVTGINQVARLLQWLQQQGCTVEKLDRKAIEKLLDTESCRRQCGACWSSGSAVPRLRSRRSTRCLPAPATTIACVAPSAITAPPPAAGPEKDSSRRT